MGFMIFRKSNDLITPSYRDTASGMLRIGVSGNDQQFAIENGNRNSGFTQ